MLYELNLFHLMRKYLASAQTQPSEGTVFAIDGQRVDIRVSGSSNVMRNVQVMGDAAALEIGQEVPLLWENQKPIVLAMTTDGSVAVAATVVTDNITIENSTLGLRVKPGGVQPWHLSFVPSIEGHTHQDSLQMAGWRVNDSGAVFKNETYIHPDGKISLGQGDENLVLDSNHGYYRMWSGAAEPDDALFAILVDGSIRATGGTIAGWDILADRLSKNSVEIDPLGWLRLGVDDDAVYVTSTTDEAWSEDWAFWIGSEDPETAPFRVSKSGDAWLESATVAVNLQSDDYVAGISGWKLDPIGTLEAQNAIIRGEIHSSVFVSDVVSVTSGRQVVSEGTVFILDVAAEDSTIDVRENVFVTDDLIFTQASLTRSEWMRVLDDGIAVDGGFQYAVTRDLDGSGANLFYAGESVHVEGGATFPSPAPLWGDVGKSMGWDGPWGGPGFKAMGGFLVYDGSRLTGPHFSVRRRFGAAYNQMGDVVRIGRLKGFLGYEIDEYGFGVGTLESNMIFSQRDGLSLTMAGGRTTIDVNGVASERFGLFFADDAPGYTDQMVRFWVDPVTKRVYANYKDGATEEEAVWLDFTAGGAISENTDKVDNLHAASSATPNYLLALDANAKLPASITGDAHTVDGLHAASFSLTTHLHDDRYFTEDEANGRFLQLAGGTLVGQLDMADEVKIGLAGGSFIIGNAALGQIVLSGFARLSLDIGDEPHISIESGQIYLHHTVNLLDAADLILYSDDGTTEVARISGTTGHLNGVDVGALDDDDGADIVVFDAGKSVGDMLRLMADMALLVDPVVEADAELDVIWADGYVMVSGEVLPITGDGATLTDDDTNYLVFDGTDNLTAQLTYDPATDLLVATVVCASGAVTDVSAPPTLAVLAREAWLLSLENDADLAALATASGPDVHYSNLTNVPAVDAAKLQGFDIDTTDPTDGKILRYRTAGTKWTVEDAPSGGGGFNAAGETVAISSGTVAKGVGKNYMYLKGESDADDTLDDITDGADGDILVLSPSAVASYGVITVAHASGKILLTGSQSFKMAEDTDRLILRYNGTDWYEVGRHSHADITKQIGAVLGGSTTVIPSGAYMDVPIPVEWKNFLVNRVRVMANASGSVALDIQKSSFGASPSFSTICNTDFPSLSSARTLDKTSFTSWTLALTGGDILRFTATGAATTITQLSIVIEGSIY